MALTFALSPGQAHDGPEGRKLLTSLGPQDAELALVMDRACKTKIVWRPVGVRPGDQHRGKLDVGFIQRTRR